MPWSEEAASWMILSRTPALGARALAQAAQRLGGLRGILAALDEPAARRLIPVPAREYLESREGRLRRAERDWLEAPHHHIVARDDHRYPKRLCDGPCPPLALYVSGDAALLGAAQLAVVGSRNPTAGGRETARRFARQLARSGIVIASGLAAGIDAAAHRGALEAGRPTLAMLGTGADIVYPRMHRALAAEIEQGGLLVSAFPIGTQPRRHNFVRRNEILASLSVATLVIEAAATSGSLITAKFARRRRRPVLAVPGSIDNPLSRGCHALIRDGARLVESPHDICLTLGWRTRFCGATDDERPAAPACATAAGMDKDHKILLDALGFDSADLDMLVGRTGLEPETVSSMMLILELQGHVQAAPGGRYSRVLRSRR